MGGNLVAIHEKSEDKRILNKRKQQKKLSLINQNDIDNLFLTAGESPVRQTSRKSSQNRRDLSQKEQIFAKKTKTLCREEPTIILETFDDHDKNIQNFTIAESQGAAEQLQLLIQNQINDHQNLNKVTKVAADDSFSKLKSFSKTSHINLRSQLKALYNSKKKNESNQGISNYNSNISEVKNERKANTSALSRLSPFKRKSQDAKHRNTKSSFNTEILNKSQINDQSQLSSMPRTMTKFYRSNIGFQSNNNNNKDSFLNNCSIISNNKNNNSAERPSKNKTISYTQNKEESQLLQQQQMNNRSIDNERQDSTTATPPPPQKTLSKSQNKKPQITSQTENENKLITDYIHKLSIINQNEHKKSIRQNKSSDYTSNRISNNASCSELIQNTQLELRILQYKTVNLICGEDLHIVMDKNDKKFLDVLQGTQNYLKIPIYGKVPPCKINFEYMDQQQSLSQSQSQKKSDLKICLSRKQKQPTSLNSEKVFNKVTVAQLDSVDPYYVQQYLYVGLYSDFGCQCTIKVSFPKDDLKDNTTQGKDTCRATRNNNNTNNSNNINTESQIYNNKTKKNNNNNNDSDKEEQASHILNMKDKYKALIQTKIRDISDDRLKQEDYFDFIEHLKRKRNQSILQKQKDLNIIAKNKMLANNWIYVQNELQRSRFDETYDRIQRALQRKKDLEIEQYKRKVFLLNKWEILKVKRNEMQENFKEKFEQQSKTKEWIILSKLFQAFKNNHRCFEYLRQKRIYERFKIRMASKIAYKFTKLIKRRGTTIEKRIQKLIKCSFTLFTSAKNISQSLKASEMIVNFLKDTSQGFAILSKFYSFYNRMLLIQKFFREQQQLDLFRLDLLRKAWDIQRDILSSAYIKTGGKVLKTKLKRLSLLTDSVREEFIKLYFKMSKLIFIIKFLELHSESTTDEQRMQKYFQILNKIEKKLGLKITKGLNNNEQEKTSNSVQNQQVKTNQQQKNSSNQQQQNKGKNQGKANTTTTNKIGSSQSDTQSNDLSGSFKNQIQKLPNNKQASKKNNIQLFDGICNLSLFFSFAPQPLQVRTMIEKAVTTQEKRFQRLKQSFAKSDTIIIQDGEKDTPIIVNQESKQLQESPSKVKQGGKTL